MPTSNWAGSWYPNRAALGAWGFWKQVQWSLQNAQLCTASLHMRLNCMHAHVLQMK